MSLLLYRPVAKWIVMPAETRASWVEPLVTVGTGLHGRRDIPPLDRLPPEFRETYPPLVTKANEQKRRFWTTYMSGIGRYGLWQRYSTVEGAWIYIWLLAEDGALRYVHDHTRDGGAAATAVDTYTPKSAQLGFFRDGKFVQGAPASDDSPILVIQLDIGRYDPVRFY